MSRVQLGIAVGVLVLELAIVAWRVAHGNWGTITILCIVGSVLLGGALVVEWLKNR